MARIETFDEAIDCIKQSFLANPDDNESTVLLDSITKSEFVNVVQNDATIMKLIDCRSPTNRRANKFENLRKISLKTFRPSLKKSLSDSRLTPTDESD